MRVIMALALMSSMSSMASLPSVVRAEDGKRDPLTVGTILKGKYTYDDTLPKTYHDWELRVKDRESRRTQIQGNAGSHASEWQDVHPSFLLTGSSPRCFASSPLHAVH